MKKRKSVYSSKLRQTSLVLALVMIGSILATPFIGAFGGKNQPQDNLSDLMKSNPELYDHLKNDPIAFAAFFSAYATDKELADGMASFLAKNSDKTSHEFNEKQILYFEAMDAFAADLRKEMGFHPAPFTN